MADHKQILRALGNGRTKRNLFGPVDHEQLQLEYNDALRKDLEEASRRWSYDFVSDQPLEGGDFQWEGVSAVGLPVMYRTCRTEEQREGESHKSEKENLPRTPERLTSAPQQHTEETPEKNEAQKRKQTNITDFYQAKRRLVATPRKSGR